MSVRPYSNLCEGPGYPEALERIRRLFPWPSVESQAGLGLVRRMADLIGHAGEPAASDSWRSGLRDGPMEGDFPEDMGSPVAVLDWIEACCRGTSPATHPAAQCNAVAPPTIASVAAFWAAVLHNANLIENGFGGQFARQERRALEWVAELVGFAPPRAGGLFTFGGTATLLYGCKLGLEKALRGTGMARGVRGEVRVIASEAVHHACANAASWLGIGTDQVIAVPASDAHELSLEPFEQRLRECLARGEKIAAIIATLGTTDAFGIDDLEGMVRIRDRLVREYALDYAPHIHADAVIGWTWCAFRGYDFERDPLGFSPATREALRQTFRRMAALRLADSIGVDFHKTGYVPYISSLFLARERTELSHLARSAEQAPYLGPFNLEQPGLYSLECSRPATGALGALANIRLLGKQGYRVLIGHAVEMTLSLRRQVARQPSIAVLNGENGGPVTLLRLYPPGVVGPEALQRERSDPAYQLAIPAHNAYTRAVFEALRQPANGPEIRLSWTTGQRCGGVPWAPVLPAIKSFMLSPWIDPDTVTATVQRLLECRASLP